MKKTLYTLSVNNYEPQITALAFPLMKMYAKKIDADFFVINERKFPDHPCPYEKFQISELSKKHGDEWSYFFDADTLIHPNFWDPTEVVGKAVTISHGTDFTPQRWKSDKYFRRDGRFIGKGNWCMIGSDWTAEDLWAPLDNLTLDEAAARITPTVAELGTVIEPKHLVDDFTISRNIARYGLQHIIIPDIGKGMNVQQNLLWHIYLNNTKEKIHAMKKTILVWIIEGMTNDPETRGTLEKLQGWQNDFDWTEFVAILPRGKKIAETVRSWGIDFELLKMSKVSIKLKKLMLLWTMVGMQGNPHTQLCIKNIEGSPDDVSAKDLVEALPLKDYINTKLESWGITL